MRILFSVVVSFAVSAILIKNGILPDNWRFWAGFLFSITAPLFLLDMLFGRDDFEP